MKSRMVHFALFIAICAICCTTTSYGASNEAQSAIPAAGELGAACRKAKAEFRPLTQSDVDQAKPVLVEALDRLDQRLVQAGPNGESWRKFLELAALRDQFQRAGGPDKAILTRVLSRFNSGYDGLELMWFLDARQALHNYLAMTYAVDNPKIRTAFDEKMDKLASTLDAYAAKPTTEDALVISESARWLQDARQAPALVEAIQHHFVHPNLFAQASAEVIGAGIVEPVDDVTPIRDCILGTDIHGTAHTTGSVIAKTSPNNTVGVLDTIFFGSTLSENVGYHGSLTIFSTGTTSLAATKRIWIDDGGLHSLPATANAVTCIDIQDIQSRKDKQMIERMAWKRAGKQQEEAECIASRHAEQRLSERIDERAVKPLDRANEAYNDKFYRPFTERKLFPQELRFSSTDRAIAIVGVQAGGGKIAAPNSPPPVVAGADMSIQIHESMINNLAFDALAGRTIYEEKLQAAVVDALGKLPEKMKGDEDGKPWAITFAARQPISITFADDGFKISIRGVKYYKGNEAHPGMNISASYKIAQAPTGFKAVRQGDIEVLPADYEPGKQIDARRQVIRKLLEKRFEKIFEPEILGEGFELPGKWKAAGKLQPIQVVARDGWLVLAWKRPAAEPKVAAPSAADNRN
jgi:hypothetical protein